MTKLLIPHQGVDLWLVLKAAESYFKCASMHLYPHRKLKALEGGIIRRKINGK